MTTFAEIKLQVITNCGGRDNDDFVASILFNANTLLTWLSTQTEWPELQKTAEPNMVIGQTSYTEAALGLSDLSRLYTVKLFDGVDWRPPMDYLTKVRFDVEVLTSAASVSGKPHIFTRFGGKFLFNVKPEAAYLLNLDYYAKPSKIVGDASVIPYEDLDGPIANILSGYGYLSIGDTSMAGTWFKLGSDQLQAIGIDTTSLLNVKNVPRSEVAKSSQPWADPFRRS